jgi:hypothetical protein
MQLTGLPEHFPALQDIREELVWDFSETDLTSGREMVVVISFLKSCLDYGIIVTLQSPQQLICHNLYRIGYINHSNLTLVNPLSDEPYS